MSTEDALAAFHEALVEDDAERLYERAPCGYLSTWPDGTIVKVNDTFLTLTGYRREDLVGRRTFSQLLTMGGRIYHETHYAPMVELEGSARGIALEIVTASGGRLPVLVNSVLERDPSGAPAVVRTAVFDATERREYERELLRAKERAEAAQAQAQELARTLQQTLVPPAPPEVEGLEVAAVYRPAGRGDEVGGDFYDVFELAPGEWVLAIGDVCGKGVAAAVVTALARHTLRAAAVRQPLPSQVLGVLNDALLAHGEDRFCTVCVLRLSRGADGWTATACSGGHPLPLLLREGERPAELGRPGTLLGVLDQPELPDASALLRPGDLALLYTDGVVEGRRGTEFYGEERLRRIVVGNAGSATSVVEGLAADVLDFQSGRPRDDIAIVAVRVPHDEVGAAVADGRGRAGLSCGPPAPGWGRRRGSR